jgi:organic hydroperoxide reductase OsmC/OhrA
VNAAHFYRVTVRWTGNQGSGTSGYRSFSREHEVSAPGKPSINGSSDPAFRGDPSRWSPEDLLVASLAQCHLLWYLHLAAMAGVVVTDYSDDPIGTMTENPDGSGQFTEVVLRPQVTVAEPAQAERALALHEQVSSLCFIARSVNFPVRHEPGVVLVHG